MSVGSANGSFESLYSFPLQDRIKPSVFAVAIPLHISDSQTLRPCLLDNRFRLRSHPGLVRMKCRRRMNDPPRFDVQERQHERFADSRQRQKLLAEKVTLPQAGRVPTHEFVPGSAGPLGARIDARRFQDIAHRALFNRPAPSFLSSPTIRTSPTRFLVRCGVPVVAVAPACTGDHVLPDSLPVSSPADLHKSSGETYRA